MKKILVGITAFAALTLFAGVASAATVVVTPSNMQGWSFINDNTNGAGTGQMVAGPATPPLGTGSAQLTTANSSDGQLLEAQIDLGTKLSQLTTLTYNTYQDASNPSDATAIALQFNVAQDATDVSAGWQGRIVYEPYYNNGGTVPLGTWNEWNALDGGSGLWWFSDPGDFGGMCPQSAPCTLSSIIAAYPNIGINDNPALGAVVLKAGSGWTSFEGNVDALTIGIGGSNTTYDFDPNPAATPSVTTGTATNVTTSDATMNATNGPVAADDGASFWVSTSPIDTSSPNIPAGVYSTPVLPGVIGAGASFQDQLSLVTTNGIVTGGNPGNMPAITPGTTYYYVAWVNVGGTWYPGNQESVIIPTPVVTPTVTTNSATGETTSSATLNGTDGSVNADETSFWWGTTPLSGLTAGGNVAEFPATGWMHDTGLASATAGSSFSENVSSLTPGQTYYFVAWIEVDGTWYPGQVLSFVVPMTMGMCPANYVPAASPLETVNVNSDSSTPTASTNPLANGQTFLLEASNTWQNSSLNVADAMYSSLSGWTNYQEGYDTTPYFLGPNEFNLEVNGNFANWGPYSSSHDYTYAYTGTGSPVNFMVFDGNSNSGTSGVNTSWYGDNSGSLSVAIYQCVPPAPPAPPADACATPTVPPTGFTLVNGTTANESIKLAPETMFVSKGNGNNSISGPAGNYVICTGSGNDSITLGNGDSVVTDTGGNNTVKIGNGNENVTTGSGNDMITVGNGNSTISGGNGNNSVTTGTGSENITTGSGNDSITTGNTGNTINAGSGNNSIHQ